VGGNKTTQEVFKAMADATGGEARALKSADDLLDVVCLQALDQVPDCPKIAPGPDKSGKWRRR
jgi:hypothetical protein